MLGVDVEVRVVEECVSQESPRTSARAALQMSFLLSVLHREKLQRINDHEQSATQMKFGNSRPRKSQSATLSRERLLTVESYGIHW